MRIPDTVTHHMNALSVPYTLMTHPRTSSSRESAHVAHVPERKVAKAILLEDGTDYCLAVVPSTHRLDWPSLEKLFGKPVRLVPETDLPLVFRDCALGAVPPLGNAYGVETLVELDLAREDELFLEGGDHEHLVHVDRDGWRRLVSGAHTAHFSRPS